MQRLFVKGDGGTLESIDPGALDRAVAAGWLWLDVADPTGDEVIEIGGRFGFDHLSLEDVLEPSQFPKVDDYGSYLFVVLHGVDLAGDAVTTLEVDLFLGRDFLITFHADALPGLDGLVEEASGAAALAEGGPDRMVARLAEAITRRYLPVTEVLVERVGELEDLAIDGHPEIPEAVQQLRRETMGIRRVLGPQRDVVLSLSREGHALIGEAARRRFADAFDLLYRVLETVDGERTQLGGVLETYRSTVAESMNQVMKVLTVFSAVLLPLTLITGIYGMNFVEMPELRWRWGYFAILAVMAAAGLGLWTYFVRRGFVGGPGLRRLPGTIVRGLGRSAAAVGTVAAAPMRLVAGRLGPRRGPNESDRSADAP
jgi:magnesium transporter